MDRPPLEPLIAPMDDLPLEPLNPGAFQLRVSVQPPSIVEVGVRLSPPITMSLRARPVTNGTDRFANMDQYFTFISVMTSDGTIMLAPPDSSLLSGQLFGDFHSRIRQGSQYEVALFTFSSLRFRRPGFFRLRVTLTRVMDLNASAHGHANGHMNGHMDGNADGDTNGTPSTPLCSSVVDVLTQVIQVVPQTGGPSTDLYDLYAARNVRMIPPPTQGLSDDLVRAIINASTS